MTGSIEFPLRDTALRLEPAPDGGAQRLIGHERALRTIVDYAAQNGGGRFLISGYGGVGKSSLVETVVRQLRHRLSATADNRGPRPLVLLRLPVQNISDPSQVGRRLMVHLRWEMRDAGLPMRQEVRDRLLHSFDAVEGNAREVVTEWAESVEGAAGVAAPMKLGMNAKRSDTQQVKTVYVPYDVNTSLLEVGQLISTVERWGAGASLNWFRRLLGFEAMVARPLPVVVIDRVADWSILEQLGNLFHTSSGTVFLVVVPPHVRAEWKARRHAGYEDLPSFHDIYLSCLWERMDELLAELVDVNAARPAAKSLYPKLIGFLTVMSAGVPRECVEILLRNREQDGSGRGVVRFDARAVASMEFFDSLYRIVERREAEIAGELMQSFADADRDRARRFLLLALREIIARGSISATDPASQLTIAPTLRPPEHDTIVRALVEVLVDERILTRAGDSLVLSADARSRVRHGREIVGTGVLPRIVVERVEETLRVDDSSTAVLTKPSAAPPAESPRPPARKPADSGAPPLPGVPGANSLVGSIIAERYQVIRKLGEGGAGSVYLAEHVKLGRQSAVKVMNAALGQDADGISRFSREASNASRINHPNVAAIYDFGETPDGLLYLVMEYVEGGTLRQLVTRERKLPPARAADITLQVAEALHAAHQLGIVHRDVKPDNIMLAGSPDGSDVVKVVDFGIAKMGDSGAQSVTRTGLVIGTPEFMSPEQVAGDRIDARTDVYALALVAFQMLTGELPFASTTIQEAMIRKLTGAPRTLREVGFDAAWADALQPVFDRGLAREASNRFSSAIELGRALSAALAPRK